VWRARDEGVAAALRSDGLGVPAGAHRPAVKCATGIGQRKSAAVRSNHQNAASVPIA
jgi:hypothetical protein